MKKKLQRDQQHNAAGFFMAAYKDIRIEIKLLHSGLDLL